MTLPIYIVCHNNGWMVRDTVKALTSRFHSISVVVVDENSTARRTLDTLRDLEDKHGVRVHRHKRNIGPKRVRRYPRYWLTRRRPFVLTDPDLDLSHLPTDTLDVLREVADDQNLRSVGLALDISDKKDLLEGEYFQQQTIHQWESQFWREPVDLKHVRPDLKAYRAPIDTTFAYYDFSRPRGRHIRIAGDYTVRHLPWHKSYVRAIDEQDYLDYFNRDMDIATTSSLVRQCRQMRQTEFDRN
jgi:hypothetical protein